jgi:hypothetical protein
MGQRSARRRGGFPAPHLSVRWPPAPALLGAARRASAPGWASSSPRRPGATRSPPTRGQPASRCAPVSSGSALPVGAPPLRLCRHRPPQWLPRPVPSRRWPSQPRARGTLGPDRLETSRLWRASTVPLGSTPTRCPSPGSSRPCGGPSCGAAPPRWAAISPRVTLPLAAPSALLTTPAATATAPRVTRWPRPAGSKHARSRDGPWGPATWAAPSRRPAPYWPARRRRSSPRFGSRRWPRRGAPSPLIPRTSALRAAGAPCCTPGASHGCLTPTGTASSPAAAALPRARAGYRAAAPRHAARPAAAPSPSSAPAATLAAGPLWSRLAHRGRSPAPATWRRTLSPPPSSAGFRPPVDHHGSSTPSAPAAARLR